MDVSVVVDTARLQIVKAAASSSQAEVWAEILVPADNNYYICGPENRFWSHFSLMELKQLFLRSAGHEIHSNDYGGVLKAVAEYARTLPVDLTPRDELLVRLGRPFPNPLAHIQSIAHNRVRVAPYVAPTWVRGQGESSSVTHYTAPWARTLPVATTTARTDGTEPQVSNIPQSAAPDRPKGGTTGRVWDICDDQANKYVGIDPKILRKHIIQACIAAGINEATAATQYSKWKRAAF